MGAISFRPTIEDLTTLSIKDFKRGGAFVPHADVTGIMNFYRGGRIISTINYQTDTDTETIRFCYTYRGQRYDYDVNLYWRASNLKPTTGYYLFVCPATGVLCRKLYFHGGYFVSRKATNAYYRKQRESQPTRETYKAIDVLSMCDELTGQRYRRETYRGRLTPYGRKLKKYVDYLLSNPLMYEPETTGEA